MNLTLTAEKLLAPALQQRATLRAWVAARASVLELSLLVFVLLVAGGEVVRAHWTSIWMDREFTGWVAPIAARFADGQVLYADGAHSPLPPLPVVLLRLLSARPTWLLESVVNCACKSLAIVGIYLALRRDLPRPAALVAALAAIANFHSLPKTIAYDAIAQALVAFGCWPLVSHLRRASEAPAGPGLAASRPLLLAAAATAACLLTKQSTGAGMFAGAAAALLLSRAPSWRGRLGSLLVYVGATLVVALVLLVALSPWISVSGFFQDVLLHGSEPKGGTALMLTRLRGFGGTILAVLFVDGPMGLSMVVALLALPTARVLLRDPEAPPGPAARTGLATTAAALLAFGLTVATVLICQPRFAGLGFFLVPLLATVVVVVGRCLKPRKPAWRLHDALFACICVTFPAAIAHNLSVESLRWTYDNNPFVVVSVAVLASAFLLHPWITRATGAHPAVRVALLALLLTGSASDALPVQWRAIQKSQVAWPEVAHLQGALLPDSASNLRKVVADVRKLAPNANDQVLLLPEDPNVQAWFERPRPALQCSIWFADQCWPRYVDTDYDQLWAHPPKVIVIGPRDYWRTFSRMLNPRSGVETLIDRVERELVALRYERVETQAISFQSKQDFLDVYRLK